MYGDVSSALYLTSTIPGLIELNIFSNSSVAKHLLALWRLHSRMLITKRRHALCPVDFPFTTLSYLLSIGGIWKVKILILGLIISQGAPLLSGHASDDSYARGAS